MSSTLGGTTTLGHPAAEDTADKTPVELFRLTVGINTSAQYRYRYNDPDSRPADNIGIYKRVVKKEAKAKRNFKIFNKVIIACYFLQIVIAASLTAMGAANANNKAITAFGAINTIIAGFLTYLKGSGYPARLEYFSNRWGKLREYIEQREREISLKDYKLDYVVMEVARIEAKYHKTKREIEMNTPDSYNPVQVDKNDNHDSGRDSLDETDMSGPEADHATKGREQSVADTHTDEKISMTRPGWSKEDRTHETYHNVGEARK